MAINRPATEIIGRGGDMTHTFRHREDLPISACAWRAASPGTVTFWKDCREPSHIRAIVCFLWASLTIPLPARSTVHSWLVLGEVAAAVAGQIHDSCTAEFHVASPERLDFLLGYREQQDNRSISRSCGSASCFTGITTKKPEMQQRVRVARVRADRRQALNLDLGVTGKVRLAQGQGWMGGNASDN